MKQICLALNERPFAITTEQDAWAMSAAMGAAFFAAMRALTELDCSSELGELAAREEGERQADLQRYLDEE